MVKGKMNQVTQKFFADEVYNCKILQRLDENSSLAFSNLEDEISDKMLPVIEKILLLLSDLRGLVKAKQLTFPSNSS